MKYTTLGRSGLQVSRLILGCMSFGEKERGADGWTLPEKESREIIQQALEAGINVFDTANAYSDGSSEEIVGRALKDLGVRDEVVLATKVFLPMRQGPNGGGLSRKALIAEVENSLRRLGHDYVDLLQIHRWDYSVPIEETLRALDDLVRDGKVRYVGTSSMYAWQFAKALYTADLHGWTRFVSMQNHYNLLNREEEREMLPLCADQGIGVIPWSPLARGRLARPRTETTQRTSDDGYGDSLYPDAESDARVIDATFAVAKRLDAKPSQVALAWMLRNPVITGPVIGVTSESHLRDAVGALAIELSDDDVAELERPYRPHAVAGFE